MLAIRLQSMRARSRNTQNARTMALVRMADAAAIADSTTEEEEVVHRPRVPMVRMPARESIEKEVHQSVETLETEVIEVTEITETTEITEAAPGRTTMTTRNSSREERDREHVAQEPMAELRRKPRMETHLDQDKTDKTAQTAIVTEDQMTAETEKEVQERMVVKEEVEENNARVVADVKVETATEDLQETTMEVATRVVTMVLVLGLQPIQESESAG